MWSHVHSPSVQIADPEEIKTCLDEARTRLELGGPQPCF